MIPVKVNNEQPTNTSSTKAKEMLRALLLERSTIDWKAVDNILENLSMNPRSDALLSVDPSQDDPLDHSLVFGLLSRDPPSETLDVLLQCFPDALSDNPIAFFAACRFTTPETISQLTSHSLRTGSCGTDKECPYPWILSDHITAEAAKAMLQSYPQGVLQASTFLSSLCPLDFFLMSPKMIAQRRFDRKIWTKFKLMLVAAESSDDSGAGGNGSSLSPVHVILKRILSRPDILDNKERARHVLWLLEQLGRSDPWVFEKTNANGLYPLHFALNHKCTGDHSGLAASRALMKLLLVAHPASARVSLNGRLPIHVAVANGWPCHDLLLSIYPEALDIRDPSTGFVPFQVAASSSNVSDLSSLDVTFELFRANPVLGFGHQNTVGTQA